MKKISQLVLSAVALYWSAPGFADTMIRIKCEDDNAGAMVFINRREVGECPLDVSVAAGAADLRVVKILGQDMERVFEKKLKVVDGVIQRVEVNLSAPGLSVDGRRKRDVAAFDALRQAADGGDPAAMNRLADAYEEGRITTKDSTQAKAWRAKAKTAEEIRSLAAEKAEAKKQLTAAEGGDIAAMEKIAQYYQTGKGVAKNDAEAANWKKRSETARRERDEKIAEQNIKNAEQQKKALVEQKINNVHYLQNFVNAGDKTIGGGRAGSSEITSFMILTPFACAMDLISSPFKTTEIERLKSELAMRPASWGNPDSMMARALQQKVDKEAVVVALQ